MEHSSFRKKQLMDEATKLKEGIQLKSSEKKADEKAPDTRESQQGRI